MTTLHEAAENIARMEAAYKATGIPKAPDVRRLDEVREIHKSTKPDVPAKEP